MRMLPGNITDADRRWMAQRPAWFVKNVLGHKVWSKQRQVLESIRDNRRTMVPSCHGAGKTFIAGGAAHWWLQTHPNSIVITTAPTMRQVSKLLWKEIRATYQTANMDLGGNLLPKAPEWQLNGDQWMCLGFSTNDSTSFQGWHSEGGNLFIFDEATGIDPEIWEAARGCLTSPRDRILAIGNPTDPLSEFARQCEREDVNVIHISAFDVPNVKERREVIPGLASYEWVLEMQEECGPSYESHPDYLSRVLGKFPDKDDRALVPLSWIDAAEQRWLERNESQGWTSDIHLGIDVARKGSAKTIMAEGYEGQGVRHLHKDPQQSTMETVGSIIDLDRRLDAASWRIDADGVGAGVADRCAEIDPRKTVEIRGGMRSEAVDKDGNPRYLNLRAEMYWTLRERLDPQYEHALALPPDKALRAQLSSIRWSTNSRGLKKIESKDEMAKRGLKSPDEADAVVYSMASPGESRFDVVGHLSAMTAL